jgi:hypothetical protein
VHFNQVLASDGPKRNNNYVKKDNKIKELTKKLNEKTINLETFLKSMAPLMGAQKK